MLAKYMVEKYEQDATSTINSVDDYDEKRQIEALLDMLKCSKFLIEAITKEFDIDEAPSVVYLFDLDRNMFWKQNEYGYTRDIFSAGIFDLEEAKKISENDFNKTTKIVYFK